MIFPLILIILLVIIGIFTASINPYDNYEASFFGRIVSFICLILIILFSLALLIQFISEILKISN